LIGIPIVAQRLWGKEATKETNASTFRSITSGARIRVSGKFRAKKIEVYEQGEQSVFVINSSRSVLIKLRVT
jgi:hypothetical protein